MNTKKTKNIINKFNRCCINFIGDLFGAFLF